MFPALNFPSYPFRIDHSSGTAKIWDITRKKWFVLTPEEWVRQHWIWHLTTDKNYPLGLIAVEKKVTINGLTKRFDILAGHPPQLLIECKAPEISIDQKTADQALRYNLLLNVPLIIISNGLTHIIFKVNQESKKVELISDLPQYL